MDAAKAHLLKLKDHFSQGTAFARGSLNLSQSSGKRLKRCELCWDSLRMVLCRAGSSSFRRLSLSSNLSKGSCATVAKDLCTRSTA